MYWLLNCWTSSTIACSVLQLHTQQQKNALLPSSVPLFLCSFLPYIPSFLPYYHRSSLSTVLLSSLPPLHPSFLPPYLPFSLLSYLPFSLDRKYFQRIDISQWSRAYTINKDRILTWLFYSSNHSLPPSATLQLKADRPRVYLAVAVVVLLLCAWIGSALGDTMVSYFLIVLGNSTEGHKQQG